MSKPWLHTREATWWVLAVFLVATVAVTAPSAYTHWQTSQPASYSPTCPRRCCWR